MDQREALYDGRKQIGNDFLLTTTPHRTAPATVKPACNDLPVKGDVVICKGVWSNDIDTHAAIITRTYTSRMVNLMLLPDMALPVAMSAVELFETRDDAEKYLASLNGAKPNVAWRRNGPNVGSLK